LQRTEHAHLPHEELAPVALPDDFDWRTDARAAQCPSLKEIRDQANCGSCWAFGSTEAFNDRMCISSDAKFTTLLSTQHTTSCCGFLSCFSQGCGGGQPGRAWSWLVKHGVVTGGMNPDTGKDDTCWPYELKMCAHHVKSTKYGPCPAETSTPSCKSSCVNTGYKTPFSKDVHNGGNGKSYSLGSVDEIKQSIFTKGPVTGAFTVYADFPTYTSGVYEHKSGQMLGGHAIRILGWGSDSGTDYWIVANSWNEDWGDAGTFKIKQGDCGIDSQVSAGDVDISMVTEDMLLA
jgi:cathepsin B